MPIMADICQNIELMQQDLPEGYHHARDYYSYSSLDTYARCPLAYKRRYIDPKIMDVPPAIPDPLSPAELGTLMHRALELSVQALWARKHKGTVTRHAALFYDNLNAAFTEQPHAAAQLLAEAQEMMQGYLPSESVYHDQIRGLEWPFELVLEDSAGDVLVKGFIDRLEVIPEGVVKILDYKSSRLLFTKDELRRSLQASIYEMAVRDSNALNVDPEMPVDIEFIMLRHPGIRQRTTRTPEQLNRAFTLVVGLVRKIESTRTFPPQLNKYCAYCEHKLACPLWRQIAAQGLPDANTDPMALTEIAEEYERLNNAAKILYRRKEEMGDLMRIHLIGNESIETRQHVYRMSKTTETEFLDPYEIIHLFHKAFNKPLAKVIRRIATIRKTDYDVLLKALNGRMSIQERREMEAQLNQLIETRPAPKLQAYKNPVATDKAPNSTRRQKPRKRMRL